MNVNELCISDTITILQAMEKLDTLATKILFIQQENRLVAALTDGDIRRWILSKGSLQDTVSKAANYSPLYLKVHEADKAKAFIREKNIEAVPLVDEEMHIEQVVFWNEENITARKEMLKAPVVMMAGGKGTRLYPYTKILPKPLIPVGEVPIAERIINQYRELGCQNFYLVVNYKKNMIKAYFNEIHKDYNIEYADEEICMGTGGGLSLLKGRIHETFILTNCDILIRADIAKIYNFHKEKKNKITMVCSLKNFRIPYGVVEFGQDGEIENLKEKPELSFFTNTGCYIVEPEVIEEMTEGEPVDFPEVMNRYRKQGERVGVYPIGEHAWLDMGQMDELERMRNVLEEDGQ